MLCAVYCILRAIGFLYAVGCILQITYGAGDAIRNPCRARVSSKFLIRQGGFKKFRRRPSVSGKFLIFRNFDFAGSGRDPLERCAMKNSADHTNSHRNPSHLGLFYGIFSFLDAGAAGSGQGPLRNRCPGRVSLKKSGVASV